MGSNQLRGSASQKLFSPEDQQAKINEVKKIIGGIADKLPEFCSDESISRYLRARNWNTKKAAKMLKETLKWRLQSKPEKITWEDVVDEAETGKVYRANFCDKNGRIVLIMRPGLQGTQSKSSSSCGGHIKYLVYCMENATMNVKTDEEQMVWLIDFQGWKMGCISVKQTREAAHLLQHHYPERLGLAIFYNPPKIFESFWTMVKPFLEQKTYRKVKFVHSDNPHSQILMQELFDMDKLESAFGGKNTNGFNCVAYSQMMREDDEKKLHFLNSNTSFSSSPLTIKSLQSNLSDQYDSEDSDESHSSSSSSGDELDVCATLASVDGKAPTMFVN